MVVLKQVAHPVRLGGQLLQPFRPQGPQDLELVAQVFDLLAPLVQCRSARIAGRVPEGARACRQASRNPVPTDDHLSET
jgi:hypothetical protein